MSDPLSRSVVNPPPYLPVFKPNFAHPKPDPKMSSQGREPGHDRFNSLWVVSMSGEGEVPSRWLPVKWVVGSEGNHPVPVNRPAGSGVGKEGVLPTDELPEENSPPPPVPEDGRSPDTDRPPVPDLEWPSLWGDPARVDVDLCPGADVLIRGCTPPRALRQVREFSTEPMDQKTMLVVGGSLMALPILMETAAAALAVEGFIEGVAVAMSWGRVLIPAL